MEPVKNLPLRSFFILTVSVVFSVVVLLSGLAVWGCMAFRAYLLPDPEAVYLTIKNVYPDGTESIQSWMLGFGEEETALPEMSVAEKGIDGEEEEMALPQNLPGAKYSVEKITRSFDTLTPKRRLAYQCCGVAMVVVPGVLSLMGILFGGAFFYQKKLARPLRLLEEATGQIAVQNLDFSLEYACRDEMGRLCRSFEQMRAALEENSRQMWKSLEQRRFLQASVAHDLRNPIAILQGYTEYLKINLPGGKLSPEKISRIADHLHATARRLALYTESVRTLNRLEDMEVNRVKISASHFGGELAGDLAMLASGTGIRLYLNGIQRPADGVLLEEDLHLDRDMVCRILENVVGNALRFARTQVHVDWKKDGARLCITVWDDGPGFPEKVLGAREKYFLSAGREDGHLGMGLAISRLFAEKHGGSLELWNGSGAPGVGMADHGETGDAVSIQEVAGRGAGEIPDNGTAASGSPGAVVKILLAV